MAGKIYIGGTAYNIKKGKTMISDTTYDIIKGKTKIQGTEYDLNFKKIYTVSGYPNSYTQNGNFTITNISRSYTNYNSTTYATLAVGGRATDNIIYYYFNNPSIPNNAVIEDVTCIVRARTTYASTVSQGNVSIQLAIGTESISDTYTLMEVDQEAHDYTLSYSNLTASDVNNLTLRLGAMTSLLTSTQHYLYVYGATLTVTYTV